MIPTAEPWTNTPSVEPQYDTDNFDDEIMTSMQNYKKVNIQYEGYFYDHAFRIVDLKVNLKGLSEYSFDYLEEQILETIGLRINKNNVVLETKMEIIS